MRVRALSWFVSVGSVAAFGLSSGVAEAQTRSTPSPGVTLLEYAGRALAVADLCAPGVSMRATKYSERRATAQVWGSRANIDATVAANADFFDFSANGYTLVIGRAKGGGEDWPADAQNKENRWYWNFGPRAGGVQKAETPIAKEMTDVVGAHYIIYGDDKKLPFPTTDQTIIGAHRRTAYGIDKSHQHFMVFVSNNSITCGAVVDQFLAAAKDAGINDVETITNEDGGGSSQLYVKGRGQVIASTRPVNNHIGIVATGSGPAPHCPNRKPAGILETVTCDAVTGWATDADAQPKGIPVHFYFGGPAGAPGAIGVPLEKAETAGQCAPFGPCNYTFSQVPPDAIYDGVEREVHAYAIDSEGGPNNELLNSPKMLKCDPKPVVASSVPDAGTPTAAVDGNGLLPLDDDSGCSVGASSGSRFTWFVVGAFAVLSVFRRRYRG